MSPRGSIALVTGLLLALAVASSTASTERNTTDGGVALGNLDAQIDGLEQLLRRSGPALDLTPRLIALLEMRGRFIGRIADYQRAEVLARELAEQHRKEPASHLALAATHALLHRFTAARSELDAVRTLGGPGVDGDRLLAAIDQATGRFDAARAHRDREASGSALELGARAALHGEEGNLEAAERDFAAARTAWRSSTDVSPFVPAWLAFEQGLLWMHAGDFARARRHLREAVRILPGYVPAQGHLAEVEAELGATATAIDRLRRIVTRSDDPDYAHQLARLLVATGKSEEAELWRTIAHERFLALTTTYPEAFADHAAEFWLGVGNDGARALRFARINAAERKTPRAAELWLRAAVEHGDAHERCTALAASQQWQDRFPELARRAQATNSAAPNSC